MTLKIIRLFMVGLFVSLGFVGFGFVQDLAGTVCYENNTDIIEVYKGNYYAWRYNFENTSSQSVEIWNYSTYWLGNQDIIDINRTVSNRDGEAGIFILNRPYLDRDGRNYMIQPGEKIRVLTTADEYKYYDDYDYTDSQGNDYNVRFEKNWNFDSPIGFDSNGYKPERMQFTSPNLYVTSSGQQPVTGQGLKDYDVQFRLGLEYTQGNNETMQEKIECQNIQVRWCGDGIVSENFGEECDPNKVGFSSSNCSLDCKIKSNSINELPDERKDPEVVVDQCSTCPCPTASLDGLRPIDYVRARLFCPDGKYRYDVQSDIQQLLDL